MTIATFSIADLTRPLLGKPFAWRGRGPDEYDCWGLVHECLVRTGVPHVPDYPSSEEGAVNAATMLDAMGCGWRKLGGPQPGAVVVLRSAFCGQWHCGFMLTSDLFLHTTEQTQGAVVERISSPLWTRLVVGYYLWEPQTLRPSRIRCPELA